ncbi:MAG: hypothetical protein H7Z12_05245 [Rhodospirillaceae bacterium]|nr:hypothetical protein [Rhodospirillales bacterium]
MSQFLPPPDDRPLEADVTIPAEYILMRHYLAHVDEALERRMAVYIRSLQNAEGGWRGIMGRPWGRCGNAISKRKLVTPDKRSADPGSMVGNGTMDPGSSAGMTTE